PPPPAHPVLQLHRAIGNRAVGALLGRRRSDDELPEQLRRGVEALSGIALGDVRVHYDSAEPARHRAGALTDGSEIHLGPGQDDLLAHESWHVVQQRLGRVRPTGLSAGMRINDDAALEGEADRMGRAALDGARGFQPGARSQRHAPRAPVVQLGRDSRPKGTKTEMLQSIGTISGMDVYYTRDARE